MGHLVLNGRSSTACAGILALMFTAGIAHAQSLDFKALKFIAVRGDGCAGSDVDMKNVAAIFDAIKPVLQSQGVEVLPYASFTFEGGTERWMRVLQEIASVDRSPKSDDTAFVFYFSGHGGGIVDEDRFEHLLIGNAQQNDGMIRRSFLSKKLRNGTTRRVILLTDCCAETLGRLFLTMAKLVELGPTEIGRNFIRTFLSGEAPRQIDITATAFSEKEGTVNVNSTAWGEQANGGVFTSSLMDLLNQRDASWHDWSGFRERWIDQCNTRFLAYKKHWGPKIRRSHPTDYQMLERQSEQKPFFFSPSVDAPTTTAPEARSIRSLPVGNGDTRLAGDMERPPIPEAVADLFGQTGIRLTNFHTIFMVDNGNQLAPIAMRLLTDYNRMFTEFQNEIFLAAKEKNRLSAETSIVGADVHLFKDKHLIVFNYGSGGGLPEVTGRLDLPLGNQVLKPKGKLQLYEMLDTVIGPKIHADDVVFVWILAHGRASNRRRELLVHGKFNDGDWATRDEILKHCSFGNRKPRLVVFITDSCSNSHGSPSGQSVAGRGFIGKDFQGAAIWKSLYFGHQGVVDISSTTGGESGLAIGHSLFAEAYMDTFNALLPGTGRVDFDDKVKGSKLDIVEWESEYFARLKSQFLPVVRNIQTRRYFENGGSNGNVLPAGGVNEPEMIGPKRFKLLEQN